jgi:hypothetical protein
MPVKALAPVVLANPEIAIKPTGTLAVGDVVTISGLDAYGERITETFRISEVSLTKLRIVRSITIDVAV